MIEKFDNYDHHDLPGGPIVMNSISWEDPEPLFQGTLPWCSWCNPWRRQALGRLRKPKGSVVNNDNVGDAADDDDDNDDNLSISNHAMHMAGSVRSFSASKGEVCPGFPVNLRLTTFGFYQGNFFICPKTVTLLAGLSGTNTYNLGAPGALHLSINWEQQSQHSSQTS